MPTVRNNGTSAKMVGAQIIPPGATAETTKYPHPDQTDLEITSHEPQSNTPVLLFSGTLPSGDIEGLAAYSELHIYNKSGADISVAYNDDTENAHTFPDGVWMPWDANGNYGIASITGAGAGDVEMWGIKPEADGGIVRALPLRIPS